MYRVGIDIGGTKINIGIIDDSNTLIANKKIYIKDIDNLCESLKNVIESLCAENSIKYSDLNSCGVGVPGTVSDDGKKLIKAPNITILSENVANELGEELSLPVTLVQDSRAAAWAEYKCGGGVGCKSVVCITLGTGIGTGIIINDKIYAGVLGSAGEAGHIPCVENGRPCGCGKNGCLEKYCAGGGLDITAEEILGVGKKSADLFEAARGDNLKAIDAINDAVTMLGRGIVSIINIMSPDCILFSGGLSEQEELYLNPVIKYVKEHCYTAGKIPKIEKAKLGENAPMIGAALIPCSKKRTPLLSASVMCADIFNLEKSLKEIEDAGIQYIHCDIMDNHFVPNLMLPMEFLNKMHEKSNLPFDYHIMAENPKSIIEKLVLKEGDYVSVHYESTNHLEMVLSYIKERGAKASIAINPATPIWSVSEVLSEIDMVLVMTVNPGFAGQKIVPEGIAKIKRMRKMLDDLGYENIIIEVDGNCSFENVPKMYKNGAEVFVVGTSSVFKKGLTIQEGCDRLYSEIYGGKN